jgi:hypothetical protein
LTPKRASAVSLSIQTVMLIKRIKIDRIDNQALGKRFNSKGASYGG